MLNFAPGVLPDVVSRDPHSGSWLVFVDLATPDVAAWLRDVVTPAVAALTAAQQEAATDVTPVASGQADAVCTVAFGGSLFDKGDIVAGKPTGLTTSLPAVVPADPHDVVFYIFSTSDATVAAFLRTIDTPDVAAVHLERGYKRAGASEVFGQPDGLRNVVPKADRAVHAFVQIDQPEEPTWAAGGSYMAYIKIQQDVKQWNALDAAAQAAVIGRNADGVRMGLAAGTAPEAEPQIAPGTTNPPANSHIRKAGPHESDAEDAVQILRRGTPYVEADSSNHLQEGLHFVSYQGDMTDFLTILQRWMFNANFPVEGAGMDALFDERHLAKFIKGGVYFAVPSDERFIGAGLFDDQAERTGVLHIRLNVVDSTGTVSTVNSLEGAEFTISTSNSPTLSWTAVTDAAGRAHRSDLPIGVELTVEQTKAPAGSSADPNAQTVTLERCESKVLNFRGVQNSTTYAG